MDLLKRYADKNKFIPMGGVKNPNSRFAIKIIAKCTGSNWKNIPRGAIKGTKTIIAEKISIIHPMIRSRTLRSNKNTNLDEIADCIHSSNLMGIWASTR
tara:strand:- start:34 stop:330 length:297 start_codon:yes stop_codon:yes gene_type:complete